MSNRASWHRFTVMECLVQLCSGKSNINLEEIIKKLADVLTSVTYLFNSRGLNIRQLC